MKRLHKSSPPAPPPSWASADRHCVVGSARHRNAADLKTTNSSSSIRVFKPAPTRLFPYGLMITQDRQDRPNAPFYLCDPSRYGARTACRRLAPPRFASGAGSGRTRHLQVQGPHSEMAGRWASFSLGAKVFKARPARSKASLSITAHKVKRARPSRVVAVAAVIGRRVCAFIGLLTRAPSSAWWSQPAALVAPRGCAAIADPVSTIRP